MMNGQSPTDPKGVYGNQRTSGKCRRNILTECDRDIAHDGGVNDLLGSTSTWWFRMLCIALCVTLLAGFYRLHIQQMRRDEKHLREVVETIPAMAFTAGPNGSDEFASRRWLKFTGSAEKAILGFDRPLTVHPDDLEDHLNKWRPSLVTGVPFENEACHCNADGTYRWFLVRAVPLRDRHGAILK
jgi:PAS domain S-box-containing protein